MSRPAGFKHSPETRAKMRRAQHDPTVQEKLHQPRPRTPTRPSSESAGVIATEDLTAMIATAVQTAVSAALAATDRGSPSVVDKIKYTPSEPSVKKKFKLLEPPPPRTKDPNSGRLLTKEEYDLNFGPVKKTQAEIEMEQALIAYDAKLRSGLTPEMPRKKFVVKRNSRGPK